MINFLKVHTSKIENLNTKRERHMNEQAYFKRLEELLNEFPNLREKNNDGYEGLMEEGEIGI